MACLRDASCRASSHCPSVQSHRRPRPRALLLGHPLPSSSQHGPSCCRFLTSHSTDQSPPRRRRGTRTVLFSLPGTVLHVNTFTGTKRLRGQEGGPARATESWEFQYLS